MKLACTIPELVEAGPFGEGTLSKHIKSGALPARKRDGRVYVLIDDWRAFLESAPLAVDHPRPYFPPHAGTVKIEAGA